MKKIIYSLILLGATPLLADTHASCESRQIKLIGEITYEQTVREGVKKGQIESVTVHREINPFYNKHSTKWNTLLLELPEALQKGYDRFKVETRAVKFKSRDYSDIEKLVSKGPFKLVENDKGYRLRDSKNEDLNFLETFPSNDFFPGELQVIIKKDDRLFCKKIIGLTGGGI